MTQQNSTVHLGNAFPAKTAGHFNLLNIMLMVSAVCIIAMFYVSNAYQSTHKATAVNASQSSDGNGKTFTVNGTTGTQSARLVSTLVADALAFKALCTTTEQASLQLNYTTTLARKWSNLPCGASCRNGVQYGSMTGVKYDAAMQIVRDALSASLAENGYDEYYGIVMAEAYLHASGGGNMWDSTLRWMAFLNTPSTTGAWMLQFGGHHYAANIAFNNGHVIGATPFFMGTEPKVFSYNGTSYAPLNNERDAFANMLASLSSTELAAAKLTQSFSDCYMIPGETNNHNYSGFPATKVGIPCSSLSQAQKDLVLATIENYTVDMDSATHLNMQSLYASEIDNTYISFTGNATAGNASSFLIVEGNYARIDGPHVWAEFVVSNLSVISGALHYHTVWRDHTYDYGQDLNNTTPLDQSLVLPLKLISFNVKAENNTPALVWVSANEVNVSHFEIEESLNPLKDYRTLGTIRAKNTTGENRYSYTVSSPSTTSVRYFRLKMVDLDGKVTYSRLVTFNSVSDILKVVNTFVTNELLINHSSTNRDGFFKVLNMQGQIIAKGLLQKGAISTIIDVGSLQKGSYILSVERGSEKVSTKFLKQ